MKRKEKKKKMNAIDKEQLLNEHKSYESFLMNPNKKQKKKKEKKKFIYFVRSSSSSSCGYFYIRKTNLRNRLVALALNQLKITCTLTPRMRKHCCLYLMCFFFRGTTNHSKNTLTFKF